ncbi:MAG: hypothetical protein JNM98_09260 [Rhodocyclaceae bacterium]|nr:hypothetical protein [Rhodocyclaceae bacterium]
MRKHICRDAICKSLNDYLEIAHCSAKIPPRPAASLGIPAKPMDFQSLGGTAADAIG